MQKSSIRRCFYQFPCRRILPEPRKIQIFKRRNAAVLPHSRVQFGNGTVASEIILVMEEHLIVVQVSEPFPKESAKFQRVVRSAYLYDLRFFAREARLGTDKYDAVCLFPAVFFINELSTDYVLRFQLFQKFLHRPHGDIESLGKVFNFHYPAASPAPMIYAVIILRTVSIVSCETPIPRRQFSIFSPKLSPSAAFIVAT